MCNKKLLIIFFISLTTLGFLTPSACPPGSVLNNKSCIQCSELKHIKGINKDSQILDGCQCMQGYKWSKETVECKQLDDEIRSLLSTTPYQHNKQEQKFTSNPRLLASSCDQKNGFIFKNGQCINCRLIQYSTGMALNTAECVCAGLYVWWPGYQVCTCQLINAQRLYLNNGVCTSCASIVNDTSKGHCNSCTGGYFGLGLAGCLDCTTIPHGNGADIGNNTGICTCQTGYKFNQYLSQCICDYNSNYSVTDAGCIACSTLVDTTDRDYCIYCKFPYFLNGYYCVLGSTIPNYNMTAGACNVGYTKQASPITNQIVSCSCSLKNGYFLSGNSCSLCATKETSGLSVLGCLNCNQSEGYFQNGVTCIYCHGVVSSTGIATINGCECLATYFWNNLTGTCQCDWVKKYTLFGGRCRYCPNIMNAQSNSAQCVFLNCSVANCDWCNSTLTCQSCVSGYILANNACVFSNCSIANCLFCNSTTTCSSCNKDLIPNPDATYCIQNYSIKNCYYCFSNNTCPLCVTGYYPNNYWTQCLICSIYYCTTCSSTSTCSSCNSGLILNKDSTQCIYNCSILNCNRCSSNSTCSICVPGSSLNQKSTLCILQCSVINCESCFLSLWCLVCLKGYSLINGLCLSYCPFGSIEVKTGSSLYCFSCFDLSKQCFSCAPLQNSFTCTVCASVSYLSANGTANNTCILCSSAIPNCLQCASSSTCTKCIYPCILVNQNCVYVPCQVINCQVCSAFNSLVCQRCSAGFNFNQSTQQCDPPICAAGFILLSGSCVCPPMTRLNGSTCVSCLQYCITCDIYGCSACLIGYYLLYQDCVPCSTNCAVCSSQGCSQCSKGFTWLNPRTCQSVAGGMSRTMANKKIAPCAPGCLVCLTSAYASNRIFCIIAEQGYSISGDLTNRCINSSCLSCISERSACKSCFNGSVLIGGNCLPCTDPNAISCLYTNLNYSTSCASKYSAASSNTSAGGYCLPCASNCLKCDVNGHGNCDYSQCIRGYVQLTGTINCTACFNSCPVCDPTNLNTCLQCGPNRYTDTSGPCKSCPVGCQACTSATVCTACQLGYGLVNSLCTINLPYPCASTNSDSTCSACFQGHALNGSACVLDLSFNNNSSCPACPRGYYLINGACLSCPTISNCLSCKSNSKCTLCAAGYYLNSTTCSACNENCLDCSSPTYCKKAASGFYLDINNDRSYSGKVLSCKNPCFTCQYNSDYCSTCINGYTITGSACFSNVLLIVQIVLGPVNQASIFSLSDSIDTKLAKAIASVNRLITSLCNLLPNAFKVNDPFCKNSLRITFMKTGSVVMGAQVSAVGMSDQGAAQRLLSASLSGGLDGASMVSFSVTGQNFPPSQSQSNSNMTLILGVSIGCVVLVIIIVTVICCVARKRIFQKKTPDFIMPSDIQIQQGPQIQMQDPVLLNIRQSELDNSRAPASSIKLHNRAANVRQTV